MNGIPKSRRKDCLSVKVKRAFVASLGKKLLTKTLSLARQDNFSVFPNLSNPRDSIWILKIVKQMHKTKTCCSADVKNDYLRFLKNSCASGTFCISSCPSSSIPTFLTEWLTILPLRDIDSAMRAQKQITSNFLTQDGGYDSCSDVGESRVWFASKNLMPCRMHWNAFLIAQIIAKCHSFPNLYDML